MAGRVTRHELADFDPGDGHLHDCPWRSTAFALSPNRANCDCAALVRDLAEDLSHGVGLLHAAYGILRRVGRYGDWDAEYHADAGKLYEELGDHLYPDGAPIVDVPSVEVGPAALCDGAGA